MALRPIVDRVPRPLAAALSCAALLAGCGGGIYIGFGGDDDRPPQVGLAASTGLVVPGQSITLVAAASDDYGVDRVEFFRLEPNGNATALATDNTAPFQIETTVPATAIGSVGYYARAFDEAGQSGTSGVVSVQVR